MDASDAVTVYGLSSLDDYTLLELLDRVPLGSLLRFGRVSHRFKQLVEWNCLHRRRQLGIVIGHGYTNSRDFKFNSITVARLDRLSVESILKLLPNITMLDIVNNIDSSDILDEMLYLLDGWADQLVVLEVFSILMKDKPQLTTLPLFGLINRMRQLKQLHFDYLGKIKDSDWTTLHLPIISQLEQLSFGNMRNDAGPLMRQLLAHGTHQLAKVRLCCPFDDLESSTLLLDAEPHLARSFTLLCLRSWEMSFHFLVTVCQQYQSLRELLFQLHLLTIGQLNRALVMLPQLTKVYLYADFPSRRAFRHQPEEVEIILDEEMEPDIVDSSQLVPLPGVTDLRLSFNLATHSDWDMLHLGVLFPNLVNLSFRYMNCATCNYNNSDGNFETVRHCLQQLQSEATFGEVFPKLCTVEIKYETLPKDDWTPNPPMPRPLLYLVSTFFGVLICRIASRQITATTGYQVVAKTASQGLLVVAEKAFKLVRQSSILSAIGLARK